MIKKTIIFILPVIFLLLIGYNIGFIRSKSLYLYPTVNQFTCKEILLIIIAICLLTCFILSYIFIIKSKLKYKKVFSIIGISILYFCTVVFVFILSDSNYHYSFTTNLDNYLVCDNKEVGEEIKDIFPEKNSFKNYYVDYSYFYRNQIIVEEDCKIELVIEYNHDYTNAKNELLNKYKGEIINNEIIVFDYIKSNNHFRKMTICYNDLYGTITYKYIDSI